MSEVRPLSDAVEAKPAALPLRSVLPAFALDVVLAITLSFSTLMLGLVGWAAWQGIRIAQQQGGAPDAQALQAQLGTPPVLFLIVTTLVSTGGTALVLYVWRRRATPVERRESHDRLRLPGTWGWALGAGLATFVFSTVMSASGRALGLDLEPSNLDLIRDGFARFPVFLALFAVVLAPLYEELLFRRVLFGRLWQAGWPVLGLVLSSLVFALVHELPGLNGKPLGSTVFLILVYAGMGAIFAWVYRRTGTLWAPIAAHILNNAIALAVLQVYGGAPV
ncbi:CPBP family intramembrane glutamic endopeptidase [Pseudoxanthomonas japonensis]|uniref:CPBP family intramembrane metalloprotease n=1 Tax=Pseudoxanthomonas japonensis TaxID=69284 RepID=A0ABQ6ZFG2_9GAMM|nr:CPBP family intramembrane glutamic endopeptidase [Pseudoxanthomonas japonensis]KAF1724270.1 CPBP family intramembrane metalloprotease [Pseudoxanthomonas japonensis]